jgi:hypothetical protein
MILRDIFKKQSIIAEGGNLSLPGGHDAQQIDLKVHNRAYIVPILNNLINSINNAYSQQYQTPLWDPKLIKQRAFLSGSSLHFFNTDIPDEEFIAKKPKVGDIDTQVNKDYEGNLEHFLTTNQGKVFGPAKLLGFQRGNEQFSSLWEFTDPPIKVQIDLEFVKYDKKGPTAWSQFSHSSSWDDLQAGIKGVFHKFLIQSFTSLTNQDFLLRKMVGRGKAKEQQDIPTTDNMVSFAVSSSEGGGLRAKYEPVLDEKGNPLVINGLPVMQALPPAGYEQDLSKIFGTIFGSRVNPAQLKKILPKTWSFVGLLELMNLILDPQEKERVLDSFINKLFAPGAQGLYKNDPKRDVTEKNAALNTMLQVLKVTAPGNLEQMRQDYTSNYRMTGAVKESLHEAEVKSQLRKNMPHLRDLKPIDFLDLLDEIHDGNGSFKLQNIPLNVKIDGFGGRFGKDAEGKPFMATSNTPPRYQAGFVQYHQAKGTTDPEILGRAEKFDQLFNEMMNAIKLVDSKLGPDFLVNKQVTCEVLFLPFATETAEGKLKFVGIQYDKFPAGVELVLVPFRVVDASTGADIPDADKIVSSLAELGGQGSVRFLSNSLVQQDGLDVTEIINPLDNIEELKQIVSDTAGKRDRASLQLRREVEEKLMPVKIALEKAIDTDPNIIGKDILGQDYEGIVINSRLGPIKVTSQQQKDIITQKNAAKAAARAEQPRTGNKTAVVAIGSFVGHKGHEELFNFTINKADEIGGDPYLFIGNAVGKDDPIPPDVKVQTWHKMYPQYAKNIGTVQQGGSLMQKIKHELINPLPGKPPRYDNIIIMVGEDQQNMPIAGALMKAVNKFQGYEHVKVSLEPTPRGTGMSFTKLRNILKDPNATPEQQYAVWAQGFDEEKLGKDWILHLMDISRKGMGVVQQPAAAPQAAPVPQPVAERLSTALIRPRNTVESAGVGIITKQNSTIDVNKKTPIKNLKAFNLAELSSEKLGQYKKAAGAQASAADKAGDTKKADKRFSGIVKATKKQFANDEKGVAEVSKSTLDRYVTKAVDDHGHADFAARQSKNDPSKRSYHIDQKKTAEKRRQGISRALDRMSKEGVAEGAPIVVAQAPIDVRNPKKAPQPYRNKGDIVPPTKPPSTEKRGVKGRPGQRPMPKYNEDSSNAMSDTAKRLANKDDGKVAKLRAAGDKRREAELKGRDIAKRNEAMLPKSAFAGSDKNKLGPAAHLKGNMKRPARAGDLVGGAEESIEREGKIKGADGKACWKGYKYAGTKNGKDKCVPVSEAVENIMDALINRIIVNEAVQNNK